MFNKLKKIFWKKEIQTFKVDPLLQEELSKRVDDLIKKTLQDRREKVEFKMGLTTQKQKKLIGNNMSESQIKRIKDYKNGKKTFITMSA